MSSVADRFTAYSLNGEDFHDWDYSTLVEQMEENGQSTYWEAEAERLTPEFFDRTIELFLEDCDEKLGDDLGLEDYVFDVSPAAMTDLKTLIFAWMRRHTSLEEYFQLDQKTIQEKTLEG